MYKYLIAIAMLYAPSPSAVAAERFPAYRAYEDTAPADWRALNERMRALGGHRGHVQAAEGENPTPAPAAGESHAHGTAGSPAPAAPAAAPVSGSHGHGHMHRQIHSHKEKP